MPPSHRDNRRHGMPYNSDSDSFLYLVNRDSAPFQCQPTTKHVGTDGYSEGPSSRGGAVSRFQSYLCLDPFSISSFTFRHFVSFIQTVRSAASRCREPVFLELPAHQKLTKAIIIRANSNSGGRIKQARAFLAWTRTAELLGLPPWGGDE